MSVMRLRTRPDQGRQARLEAVLDMLDGVPGAEDVLAFVGRKLAAGRGWNFVMVDPVAYQRVVKHLRRNSGRPLVALELFSLLFSYLSPSLLRMFLFFHQP